MRGFTFVETKTTFFWVQLGQSPHERKLISFLDY